MKKSAVPELSFKNAIFPSTQEKAGSGNRMRSPLVSIVCLLYRFTSELFEKLSRNNLLSPSKLKKTKVMITISPTRSDIIDAQPRQPTTIECSMCETIHIDMDEKAHEMEVKLARIEGNIRRILDALIAGGIDEHARERLVRVSWDDFNPDAHDPLHKATSSPRSRPVPAPKSNTTPEDDDDLHGHIGNNLEQKIDSHGGDIGGNDPLLVEREVGTQRQKHSKELPTCEVCTYRQLHSM